MKRLIAFVSGFICIAVTQIATRIPLLAHFDYELTVLNLRAPFLVLLILAFSAGIFEETGRFLFYKTALRGADFTDAMLFGLGHSLMEIFYLFMTAGVFAGLGLSGWAILERVSATLFHMASAAFILGGMRRGKGARTLLCTILFHALFNLVAVLCVSISVPLGEGLLLLVAGIYFGTVARTKSALKEAI